MLQYKYTAPFLLFYLAAAHVALAFTDGLLKNGNFEQGPKPADLKGTRVLTKNAIPDWETSGFIEYIPSGHKQGDMLLVVPEGSFAVRLGNNAYIKQKALVQKGTRYSITFSAARTCAQNEQLNISAGPDSGTLPIQTMYSSNGWDSYAWAFKASSSEVDIVVHDTGDAEDPACGPLIDSVAMKALESPKRTGANLLKNGGFEEGPYVIPGTTWGVLIPPHIEDGHSPLPGWIVESLKAVKYIDSGHFAVPEGRRAVELVGGMEGAVAQVVRTVPGKSYTLSFSVGDGGNACRGSLAVEAFAGKGSVRVLYESVGRGGSRRGVLRFVAVGTRTRVVFLSGGYSMRSDDLSSLCGPVLDNVVLVSSRVKARKLV